jgi:cell division septation protein DedD
MKKTLLYLTFCMAGILLIQACGPSEAELQQREQARLDSLECVRMQRVEQARIDSMAMVQRQLEEERRFEEERRTINYASDGPFTVQVGSWRSESKAQELVATWKNRGFENAYFTKFGTEETGDVWFRVRLGRVSDRNEAEKLQALVKEDYNVASWVDSRP